MSVSCIEKMYLFLNKFKLKDSESTTSINKSSMENPKPTEIFGLLQMKTNFGGGKSCQITINIFLVECNNNFRLIPLRKMAFPVNEVQTYFNF